MSWVEGNAGWIQAAREHWSPSVEEPCEVTAWLSAPIAWDGYDPLTLEGALQSAVVLREAGRTPCDVFKGCPEDAPLESTDIQIPITDDRSLCDVPLARCSVGFFSDDAVQSTRYVRKRPRAENYSAKTVNIAMAEYKASNQPVATVTCLFVRFWCVGDPEKLRDLLTDCGNLGADRSGGLGAILAWQVESHSKGDLWLLSPENRLRRSVPESALEHATNFERRMATLRAPYWHKRTQRLCKVPIVEVGS